MKLKPYPTTKDSGLDWIGEIPAHWKMSRNGRLFSHRVETDRPELPILEVSLKTGVTVRQLGSGRKQAMSDRSKYKVAEAGDIAYNMMRMWQGAVGVAPVSGLVSPAYVIAQPRPGIHTGYYSYLFRTATYKEEVNRRSRGIVSDRNRLYWQDFKQMPALQPPADEQERIAKYLDDHGRQTDDLIRSKRRLVALLNEQKQAIIQRAVTRGLDPDVPTKQSRWDEAVEIPLAWDTRALKHWVKINELVLPEGTPPSYEFDYLDIGSVGTGQLIEEPERVKFGDAPSRARRILREGDTIISTVRTYLKAAAYVPNEVENLIASTGFAVLSPGEDVDPDYLSLLIQSDTFTSRVTAHSTGIAYPAINESALGRLLISLPPTTEEQDIIVRHVRDSTAPLTAAADQAEEEIELIREYRARLIADVVTGRISVQTGEASSESTPRPSKKVAPDRRASVPFQRATVAAEITSRLRHTRGFGRVVLQKALVITSGHLKVDLGLGPKRDKLGPFDSKTMWSIHSQFERSKWFRPVRLPGGWRYDPLDKCGAHGQYLPGYLNGQTDEFDRLMNLFAKMDMDQAEIIGTLYTAWNDEIIDGNAKSTDGEIVDQVWNHWHEHKQRFGRDRWLRALSWMRDPEQGNIIPTGFGASSKPKKP